MIPTAICTGMNNHYFQFNYDHTKCCIFGEHDNNIGMSAYVKNNVIYCSCFSETFNKRQHKKISLIDNDKQLFDRCQVIYINEAYLSTQTINIINEKMLDENDVLL